MKRVLLIAGALTLAMTAGAATHFAQGGAAEPDFNAGVAGSPEALRNGVATYEQVTGFLGVDDSELHGEPVWEIYEEDVNQDGARDLMISNRVSTGVHGQFYSLFIGSSRGYRYAGEFEGDIRTLPVEAGKPVRFVITNKISDNRMQVELAELQASGLRRLAKAEMTTAGCEAGDNAAYTELVCGKTVSAETLKNVFGAGAQ
ncbi:MAG TPA: hypothetical protein VFY29_18885 [Terriglobia bacterium]|nr:hypothetical protein [Terriglobia bacterium]